MQPFVDSTDLIMDGAALAQRMDRDGYLFIRDLLPMDAVANVGRQFRDVVAEGGWLDPGHPKEAGIANLDAVCADPEPAFLDVFRRFYVREDSHALKHHPNIIALFERMFGEEVLVHPLYVARNIFPQRELLTTRPRVIRRPQRPPHRIRLQVYLRRGRDHSVIEFNLSLVHH